MLGGEPLVVVVLGEPLVLTAGEKLPIPVDLTDLLLLLIDTDAGKFLSVGRPTGTEPPVLVGTELPAPIASVRKS